VLALALSRSVLAKKPPNRSVCTDFPVAAAKRVG